MDVVLTHKNKGLYGIFGEIRDLAGNFLAVTLEHAFKQSDGSWSGVIPDGQYVCERRQSPHFGYDLFCLQNVPGHSYVEIHVGNVNSDSEGCILLGSGLGTNCILDSRVAFQNFMKLQDGVKQFNLIVKS